MGGKHGLKRQNAWVKAPALAPTQRGAREIAEMADRVLRGDVVGADLSDGTFVLLMKELNQRGYQMTKRSEANRFLKPFVYVVEKNSSER
jgi:hypothetical protein